ncbi:PREDICTED: TNF receptor-associated factor 5-like isoform X2 [Amphimedon queenslandica]|uniref:RING-type domain-containing protein n=1 Tax=Amphimedon queenslandica TaxID=400682 RepID=A0AAN0IM95_AMPQE|nr:PREDICTED: TNF receptor-associated factor 5-like isoform X1 [Amphimedon queenslandica]XP_019852786.1 PREDICTED: TNF receptor-associated factor 5-like isoform X2 [Amphimedon queenslandica]|eukprot:XP_011404258.2 PREDICTED: TNF receptor-associated factor 5-like isoform X1 [Amphimedon queenslandica]
MSHFSKDELSFVKELPEHVDIECPVCLNILTDPHQVSCCGRNFCGYCIERIKASNGACPICKQVEYRFFPDKKCLRIINGLQVHCTNKSKGCEWRVELRSLSIHLNHGKREGECLYEEVQCQHVLCSKKEGRCYLKNHEQNECPQRPYQCQFCKVEGAYFFITEDHSTNCSSYPVPCPNTCTSSHMSRQRLNSHIAVHCPLQPVNCAFSWAGCNEKPLRKDMEAHTSDAKHMTLLAVACGQLKNENEEVLKEINEVKAENEKIKEENRVLREKITNDNKEMKEELSRRDTQILSIFNIATNSSKWLLPIDITITSGVVHFYTSKCGHHMSASLVKKDDLPTSIYTLFLAFHEGIFDSLKPKVLQIFGKYKDRAILLIEDTEKIYDKMPYEVLDEVNNNDTVPTGVIKRELGESLFIFTEDVHLFVK